MSKATLSSILTQCFSVFLDLFDLICDSICVFAHTIDRLLMPKESSMIPPRNINTIQPASAMKTKVPSMATRRAACTHLTMERLYGNYHCDVCHRQSQFGWVYLCTQDDLQGPASGSVDEKLDDPISAVANYDETFEILSKPTVDVRTKLKPPANAPEYRMPASELTPWITNAIKDKQYSPEQVEILKAQKRNVVDVANAAIEQYEQETVSKDVTCHLDSAHPSGTNRAEDDHAIEKSPPPALPRLRMFPYCRFQACQACRPTFRDRAWQQPEDVYVKDASAIVASQENEFYDTRPLADCRILREIGCRAPEPHAPSKPPLIRRRHHSLGDHSKRSKYQRALDGPAETAQLPYATENAQLADPAIAEPEDIVEAYSQLAAGTKSFRENIRRVLEGLNRRDSSRSSRVRKMVSGSRDSVDAAIGLSLHKSLLEEAASVPLPEQKFADSLVGEVGDVEKVQVADGVAVKEESADLGAADVII